MWKSTAVVMTPRAKYETAAISSQNPHQKLATLPPSEFPMAACWMPIISLLNKFSALRKL
jgi:hypothetical protein